MNKENKRLAYANFGSIFGKQQMVFSVKTKNGDKIMSFNKRTLNALWDAFGEDTEKWKGQMVKANVFDMMTSTGKSKIIILCGLEWDLLDDLTVAKRNIPNTPNTYDGGKEGFTNEEGIHVETNIP